MEQLLKFLVENKQHFSISKCKKDPIRYGIKSKTTLNPHNYIFVYDNESINFLVYSYIKNNIFQLRYVTDSYLVNKDQPIEIKTKQIIITDDEILYLLTLLT